VTNVKERACIPADIDGQEAANAAVVIIYFSRNTDEVLKHHVV